MRVKKPCTKRVNKHSFPNMAFKIMALEVKRHLARHTIAREFLLISILENKFLTTIKALFCKEQAQFRKDQFHKIALFKFKPCEIDPCKIEP